VGSLLTDVVTIYLHPIDKYSHLTHSSVVTVFVIAIPTHIVMKVDN